MKEELAELLRLKPFIPLCVFLVSGERHEIANPQLVAIGESVIHVMRPKSNRYVILRLSQIASIEVLEPAN